jgi:hypothetical protein
MFRRMVLLIGLMIGFGLVVNISNAFAGDLVAVTSAEKAQIEKVPNAGANAYRITFIHPLRTVVFGETIPNDNRLSIVDPRLFFANPYENWPILRKGCDAVFTSDNSANIRFDVYAVTYDSTKDMISYAVKVISPRSNLITGTYDKVEITLLGKGVKVVKEADEKGELRTLMEYTNRGYSGLIDISSVNLKPSFTVAKIKEKMKGK